jgi:hypothetical protein
MQQQSGFSLNANWSEDLDMSPISDHREIAHKLGLQAARKMALQSATIPTEQIDETYYREVENLAKAIELAAGAFAIHYDHTRSDFEAVVSDALETETDRILSLIVKGSISRH